MSSTTSRPPQDLVIDLRSDESTPSVSVLIPMLNEIDAMDELLETIRCQDYTGSMEFLLIDGGSTDGTLDCARSAARSDQSIRVLNNPGRTTPRGLNVGLHHSTGRYVVRMDAHTRFPANYVRSGVERIRNGDVASASGPVVAYSATGRGRQIAIALRCFLGAGDSQFRLEETHEVEVPSGFCGIWRRSLLEDLGGWDEATYPNEDAELAARVRATGGSIVCTPTMAAEYQPRDSLPRLAKQYWRYGQFRNRTAVLHPTTMRPAHVLPPALSIAATVSALPLGPAAQAARGGLVLYSFVVSIFAAREAEKKPSDLVGLPMVFATIHLSWGFGFLRGMTGFGVPWAGMRNVVGEVSGSLPARLRSLS